VPAAAARADAEGIEHHVSAATLAAMNRFLAAGRRPKKPAARRAALKTGSAR